MQKHNTILYQKITFSHITIFLTTLWYSGRSFKTIYPFHNSTSLQFTNLTIFLSQLLQAKAVQKKKSSWQLLDVQNGQIRLDLHTSLRLQMWPQGISAWKKKTSYWMLEFPVWLKAEVSSANLNVRKEAQVVETLFSF